MKKQNYIFSGTVVGIGLVCLAAGPLWAQGGVGGGEEPGGGADSGQAARAGTGNQVTNQSQGIPESAPGDDSSFNDGGDSDAMQQAYKDYSQKKFAVAVPELQKILKKSPNIAEAHEMLADIYLRQNQAPQAIPELEAVVRLQPKRADFRANLGVAYLQGGDTAKATAVFQTLMTQYPANSTYAFDYARALTSENKPAEAAAAFDKTATLDPKNTSAVLYAGLLYHQAGNDAKAVPALKAALASGTLTASDKFSAYSALADAATTAKQNSDAAGYYTQAAEANPADFGTEANLGVLLQNSGNKAGAEDAYRKALTLKADSPKSAAAIQENLAGLLKSDGKLDEAASLLTQAAASDPTSVALQDDLGSVYEKQGKKDQALAAYKQALTINPNNGLAKDGLARLSKP